MDTASTSEPYLGFGNQKVGKVWTFSLPSLITCPGASPWCLTHCYAWRIERRRPQCRRKYAWNLLASLTPEEFVDRMLRQLPNTVGAVRIHVGGDMFNADYIAAWRAICQRRPQLRLWTYTRSWMMPSLRAPLEALRACANVQVFASCDLTMPDPPCGWRVAWIEGDPRALGMPCREQRGQVDSCLECGYCFVAGKGDVIFRQH